MHVYSSAPPRLRRPELHNAMAILPPNTPSQKLTPSVWPIRHVMNSPQVNKAPKSDGMGLITNKSLGFPNLHIQKPAMHITCHGKVKHIQLEQTRALKLTSIVTIPIFVKTIEISRQIHQCSKRQVGEPGEPKSTQRGNLDLVAQSSSGKVDEDEI